MRHIIIPFSDIGHRWSATYHLQRGHAEHYLQQFKPEEREGPVWESFLIRYYRRWFRDAMMEIGSTKRRTIIAGLPPGKPKPTCVESMSPAMWDLLKQAWLAHEISRLKVQKIIINQRLQWLQKNKT